MEHALEVPGFGILKGTKTDGIAEFQNVQYAEIKQRFAHAKLIDRQSASLPVLDCTDQGPLCFQKEPFNDDYNGVPTDECAPLHVRYDEEKCLNFRIHIPIGYSNLPVVVWLHGGSNIAGTPYRGSSQASNWLKKAIKQKKPFIFISPHYRVGLFGWLPWDSASKSVPSSVGPNIWYNQAIDDQRLAVQWVLKYGPSIGADVSRISLIGQSAGASDAYAHLVDLRSTKLVHQLGLLSGHVGSSGFATCKSYAKLAERIAEQANCSVKDLATLDPNLIVQAQNELGINVFAPVKPQEELLAKPLDAPRLIVGDCIRDGQFFTAIPEAVKATPEGYETCEFFTQIVFRKGANELWDAYPNVLRQLCDGTNPYTPSWGNNHMVELHFIINGYNLTNNTIFKTQDVWTDLVNLETPWDPTTQAFHIPTSGEPRAITKEEARKIRPVTTQNIDDTKYNELIRGW